MVKINYATKEDVVRIEKKLDEMKDDNLNMKLEILKELKDWRENNDVHDYSYVRVNDELQEHDKRLKHLETS